MQTAAVRACENPDLLVRGPGSWDPAGVKGVGGCQYCCEAQGGTCSLWASTQGISGFGMSCGIKVSL